MPDESHPLTPHATYNASGRVQSGGAGTLSTHGFEAPFDGSDGRIEGLAGPADLLCAALCACILKNVERFSHRLDFQFVEANVDVVADRQNAPPLIFAMRYELRVVTDEPPARVELLHKNIRRFGTITNTLGRSCELTGSIVAIPTTSTHG